MRDQSERAEFTADVAIVGGGLVGPAAALALAREGLTSVLCDPLDLETLRDPEFDGRAYAVALASRRFLAHLDLWRRIEPHAEPIRDILVSDGRPGERASPLFLHFDSAEMGPDGFGHMVEDRYLRGALLDAIAETPAIRRLHGVAAREVEVDEGRARVALADGRRVVAAAAIGCDGRDSIVARALGVDRIRASYGQVGLVCAVRHERPHRGVAHEYFLPGGPFAILPLPDGPDGGHRSALVWTEREDLAEAFEKVDDAIYLAEVRRRFGGFLGALTLEGRRWVYPLSLSVADRFAGPRLALAGDAARGIHPIAGQGVNYGFRDAAALAEILGEAARRGEDLGDPYVLARYETWRRPDSVAIGLATDALNRLFSNDIAPIRLARRLGLAAFGRVGPLRRAAMRVAAGARSDLPRSMRA